MDDIGFRGAGSRFNSRFTEDDGAGLAKQLNDLAQGVQAGLPMPYIGEGQVVSYVPGGSQIYKTDDEFNKTTGKFAYLNQFKCIVEEVEAEGGGKFWTLQIVNGSMIWAGEHQMDQDVMSEVYAGSPVIISDGDDPASVFMNKGGWVQLAEEFDYGVYLIQIRSEDRKKFINYVYVANTYDYNYPTTGWVPYGDDGVPPGIDLPLTGYSLQVLEIALINWDSENEVFDVAQMLIGSQTMPAVLLPFQFKVEIINNNPDVEATAPYWALRIAKGEVLSSPDAGESCTGQDTIDTIALGCFPVDGYQDVTPWCNKGGYYGPLSNDTDYSVWLFRVTETLDGATSTYYKLWVGPDVDYVDACPVVLPANIAPDGEYVAQSIWIAFASQPYSADTWLVDQYIQGSITFPAYVSETCSPFKVKRGAADGTWTVCPGMVNNEIPTNIDSVFSITDGFIYLEIPYDATNKAFPEAGGVILAAGLDMPTSDKDFSYVAVAQIVSSGTEGVPPTANQLLNGSLWGDRIQVGAGDTETAYYYYAGV